MLRRIAPLVALFVCTGCAGAVVEPGHRALFFNPRAGGIQKEVLGPGYYKLGMYGRLEDFDITYSTRKEVVHTTSSEGLQLDIKLAVIFRPIVSELYELDTEIGPNYYEEVIGPEFRSAAHGVFARHSYLDLQKHNEKIEDEIEQDLRRRVAHKHLEISSITMEDAQYAPEIATAVRAKLVGEQEAVRQKAAIENESLRRKLELQNQAEQAKLKAEAAVREKQSERALAEEEAKIERVKAETEASVGLTQAKAEAEERTLLAKAHEAEKKAEAKSLTWMEVQMHAYDALGKLGGDGTHILIGDWAKLPNFLFPAGMGGSNLFKTAPTIYDDTKGDAKPTKPAVAPASAGAPANTTAAPANVPASTTSLRPRVRASK
jgi:regulator of protease activity HflC (stomatin/prohibitin superfamily)